MNMNALLRSNIPLRARARKGVAILERFLGHRVRLWTTTRRVDWVLQHNRR
jgi:hypothetical protein